MRHIFVLCAVLTVAMMASAPLEAGEQRPFTVHDMVAMQRVADPQPSPDGTRVAFVVSTPDLEANRGRSDLWIAATDGSGARRLTTHPASDFGPRWLDDTTLLFLSSRSGSSQVWRLPLAGGEAEQLTDLALDVGTLTVGPGGHALYLSLSLFPSCGESIQCTVDRLAEEAARRTSGMIFDRLLVRHWDQWVDGTRNHVVRLPLGEDGLPSGEPLDLMAGVDGHCPTVPWGGAEDFTVSPDDRWLVYTAKVVEGSEEAWSTDWDLWVVPTDGAQPARCLTETNQAWDASPAFSPDGARLAYLAMARAGYEADRFAVMLMDWPDGQAREITPGWDRSPSGLVWAPDGKSLLTAADNIGNHSLFRLDIDKGRASAVVTRHSNSSPSPLADGSVVFRQDSLISPAELFVTRGDAEPLQLTNLNGDRLAELSFGNYKQFDFVGAHQDQVHGYFLYPADFDPKKTYPLAFLIHGGPQGSFDDHWHYRWNPQIYAAHGYAAVMIDFHGSTGYGQSFTDAINRDWGGAPYEDLMKGLDDVLRRHPWIDSSRVAALGASYGGFMVNWIQGQTDRFAALVSHDGNLDETMAYFDTEELWFPEWDHGGTPWENPEGYAKHSPMRFVDKFSTPQLVIHGALDYRVVDTQGLGMFNALQRRGVPSRLLYFPDENHWVLKPLNSIQWHEVVLDWIDRWTAEQDAS